ncbi:Alcohol dehydrogenase superfamily, zinc-type [Pleurostoma richardsiae]|uniref:Alcohol dehydrogenase superfamily, zinc-type n=1 Tax=Pleurostoma richardsiae TaxID=41990 RepID=A0AA38VG40_9PEZI|nr:Alcohol dehydrogenase superfamily, zinc-type [Pleurostoma richardsiae]
MAVGRVTIPAKQKALCAADANGAVEIAEGVDVVRCDPDGVLVKTAALALNPVDTKMINGFLGPGCILGFDFAGTVVEIGAAVPASRGLRVGDRVFGCADGVDTRRPLAGAFAEYTTCPASLVVKMHPDQPFADAAAMGTAISSAGLALFRQLGLPLTFEKPRAEDRKKWVLVYGGATSTGTMMIQLLARAGYRVVTTCSPANNDLVAAYGAERAFDYRAPSHAQDIRDLTGNALDYAVDCVTVPSSTKACYAAIGRAGGRYAALDPYEPALASRRAVTPGWILATTISGRGSVWPAPYGRDGDPALRAFGEAYFPAIERILARGADQIKPHPVQVRPGGLEGILEGIDEIRRKEVRGFKLVYPVEW